MGFKFVYKKDGKIKESEHCPFWNYDGKIECVMGIIEKVVSQSQPKRFWMREFMNDCKLILKFFWEFFFIPIDAKEMAEARLMRDGYDED